MKLKEGILHPLLVEVVFFTTRSPWIHMVVVLMGQQQQRFCATRELTSTTLTRLLY